MLLLNTTTFELVEHCIQIPPYAILSHRWEFEEATFKHFQKNTHKELLGWKKIEAFCGLAKRDGYDWGWADTCCIDKSSSAELSEAINSMFRWYRNAGRCYAYLSDVSFERSHAIDGDQVVSGDDDGLSCSQWFKRGWTLQELLAPAELLFFNREWLYLGDRHQRRFDISAATQIPDNVLTGDRHTFTLNAYSVAARMSWAAGRMTTRPEDRAYSLLGLFDVYMPLLYGEGEQRAFERLQLEIIERSDDETIFVWNPVAQGDTRLGVLARSVDCFAESAPIVRYKERSRPVYTMTHKGLFIELETTRSLSNMFLPVHRNSRRHIPQETAVFINAAVRMKDGEEYQIGLPLSRRGQQGADDRWTLRREDEWFAPKGRRRGKVPHTGLIEKMIIER